MNATFKPSPTETACDLPRCWTHRNRPLTPSNYQLNWLTLPDNYHKDLHWIEIIDLVYSNSDKIVPIQHTSLYQRDLPQARTHVIADSDRTFQHGDLSMLIALLKT